MRYGLMSNVRCSWSKVGIRTVFPNQQEFANRYLYSAIDPIEGNSHHLIGFDDTSTEQTNLFIASLQERYPDDHLVIVWDNAPFHKPKTLHRRHLTLIYLPAYSPQLNPVERFFGELRKITANKIFTEGIDLLSKTLEKGLLTLTKNIVAMKSLCGYPWIRQQWSLVQAEMITRRCS
jgi:transposase